MNYGIRKSVPLSFSDARERVQSELAKEGFGVLTEIDMQATLKKKLDVEMRRYVILGTCNPPFACKALNLEEEVGLLMPCNVIIYENKQGETVVSAMNVEVAMGAVAPSLMDLAKDVSALLKKVIDRL